MVRQRSRIGRIVIGVSVVSVLTASCATMGSGPDGQMTELDRAGGRCVAAVVVGSLLGAVVGNNVGGGNAGRGALIGAGAGGIACAIIREAAKEKDAILAYQMQAAQNGTAGRNEWVSASGKRMVMSVEVEADNSMTVLAEGAPAPFCRYSNSTVEIDGMGSAALGRQRWCRGADGAWTVS